MTTLTETGVVYSWFVTTAARTHDELGLGGGGGKLTFFKFQFSDDEEFFKEVISLEEFAARMVAWNGEGDGRFVVLLKFLSLHFRLDGGLDDITDFEESSDLRGGFASCEALVWFRKFLGVDTAF